MLFLYKNLLFCKSNHKEIIKRIASTRPPEAVFIEKALEVPVIVINEQDDVDLIGAPDPVSNLRPILRKIHLHETPLQQKLREMQDATQSWNQGFWAKHNTKFMKEKQEFINSHQIPSEEKKHLTADEMSEFYKRFLDDTWETHLKYNIEWYRRNFTLLFLALCVSLERNYSAYLPK
ncbi:unnamed protein product [Acanthoscelides obtectus]|uniref:APOPT family protein CG14806, mitochondrial n=1 Tax=Acanthoscelides obtectus TaxID=200917 RepID=A0A9P0JX68_ACAOB|nr:unnamed protein product [Acanthoscelides obtectus]CAK1646991.1 Apoptogenic protein 1, mitochondrial [Acanthoscelides obtectus]